MLPPAPCKMDPGSALELGAWVSLSAYVGGLLAYGSLILKRRLQDALASYREARLEGLSRPWGRP